MGVNIRQQSPQGDYLGTCNRYTDTWVGSRGGRKPHAHHLRAQPAVQTRRDLIKSTHKASGEESGAVAWVGRVLASNTPSSGFDFQHINYTWQCMHVISHSGGGGRRIRKIKVILGNIAGLGPAWRTRNTVSKVDWTS